ncbi:MAG: WYL domain-containing protein [Clostridia bacterium]|nr:WYL domain-containing protein [Lachnospiraceae bacterium]NCC00087.1 WYL domain-containing protein [Clostridia bacterium]NCD01650.1 WYL domain-containing protein [Clostridia bacterium]
MAKSPNQKIKILYLMRAFLEKTDENHPMNTQALIDELALYGIQAERKSIYTDIEVLRVFGMDILNRREQPSGYYLASRDFELAELKLLVDVVQSSKFITAKKSAELIEKLESLTSHFEARQLQRQVFVANRIKTMNESIYYNVDKIHNAISANVKIEFQYFEWTVPKTMTLKKGGGKYCISPWVLTWEDENYYLLGFDEEAGIVKHYRVDKMLSIEMTKAPRVGREHFEHFDTADFSKKIFGMFAGEEEGVKIRFENRFIGVVIDRFGKDISIRPVDENHFDVRVPVVVSNPFFGWLSGLGKGVQILTPEKVVGKYRRFLKELLDQYEG